MSGARKLVEIDDASSQTVISNSSKYTGRGTTLESALGAIIFGQLYGWRVLKMIHNPSTYSKYEKILGIKFKDVCPERTELSTRNAGVKMAEKLDSFWAIVKGRRDVPNKAYLEG